jgi:hypothetical protein
MPLTAEQMRELVIKITGLGKVHSLLFSSFLVKLLFMLLFRGNFLFLVKLLQLFGIGQFGVLENYLL